MNLTYVNDKLHVNGVAMDFEDADAAAIYGEILVNSILTSLEYSPRLQVEFFERLRPAAVAYYDWRIMPVGQWKEYEAYLRTDEETIDDDDLDEIYDADADDDEDDDEEREDRLLDNLLQIRIAVNALIEDIVEND